MKTEKKSSPVKYTVDEPSLHQFNDYQGQYATEVKLVDSSQKGLAATAALDFINMSGFSQLEFQHTFKTTVKTIQNYVSQHLKLDAAISEKLLKSFALFEKGIQLFGSAQAFYQWLNQPAYGLGDRVPYQMMETVTGMMLIDDELTSLEYGDLA